MKQSPRPMGRLSFPVALLVSLCMLLLLLTPTASALSRIEDGEESGCATAMMQHEDGRVTDEDGRIGNGTRGADRAPTRDEFARGIVPDASGTPTVPDAVPDHEGGAVVRDGVSDDIMPSASGDTTTDADASGLLGWIIGILVVLSVALVVLALLPKRGKSR